MKNNNNNTNTTTTTAANTTTTTSTTPTGTTARIWENPAHHQDEPGTGYLLPEEIIETKINFKEETVYIFPGLAPTAENEAILEALLPALEEAGYNMDEIGEVFDATEIKYELAGETEYPENILIYFANHHYFGNLQDCEAIPLYEYHDGSNWEEIWRWDDISETIVVYNDQKGASLDRWDGSNWYYRNNFNHASIYPVVEIDGEAVEGGKYLLKEWSQYQGSIPTGRIIDAAEKEELESWA